MDDGSESETEPQSFEELKRAWRSERQRAKAAERRADAADERADAADERNRPTTLDEYLSACHSLVFSRLAVETDMSLTSKGGITNPRDKWCPTNLRRWPNFLQQQKSIYSTLYDVFPPDLQAFRSRIFLAELGDTFSAWRIADEKMLESFLHFCVEGPVKLIIGQLKDIEEARIAFNLGRGITFENHPHAVGDNAEEVLNSNVEPSTPAPPSTPGQTHDFNQLQADQICIYRSDDGELDRRSIAYVCEYKPPHKLTAPHLRRGLRPINIYKDVANRKTIPPKDTDEHFQFSSEKLVASAVTQTYHYMIEGGLEYALLTTGEAYVFLKVDWQEPETLYYHLAEPNAEALAHPDHFHLCSAVGQCLAFTLMALRSLPEGQHGQRERQQAMQKLNTWSEDFESVRRSIPESERGAPDSGSEYQPEVYENFDRTPVKPQTRKRRRGDSEPTRENVRRRDREDDSSDDEPRTPDSPSPEQRRSGQGQSGGDQANRRSQRNLSDRTRGETGQRQAATEIRRPEDSYCTQKCLLGLVDGGSIDYSCPNAALHGGQSGSSDRHPIRHDEFLELLRAQLAESLDDGVLPLGIGGARGVLFKVTLLGYGYTFASKGTVRAFVKDLEHEAAVYARLKPLQGIHVPVFLGAIDLRPMGLTYYYDHRVYVIHMSFLSWAGTRLDSRRDSDKAAELRQKVAQSLRALHENGVAHTDVREPNMLLNAETGGVMVIDFERALLAQPPRPPLALMTSPNKRRRMMEMGQKRRSRDRQSLRAFFAEDSAAVSRLFSK